VLASNTVTEVLPLSFGGGGMLALEPHPVVIPITSSNVRVSREKYRDAEGEEDEAAFIDFSNKPATS
jgi:hypothetical protein